jgi:hypothetical protein
VTDAAAIADAMAAGLAAQGAWNDLGMSDPRCLYREAVKYVFPSDEARITAARG